MQLGGLLCHSTGCHLSIGAVRCTGDAATVKDGVLSVPMQAAFKHTPAGGGRPAAGASTTASSSAGASAAIDWEAVKPEDKTLVHQASTTSSLADVFVQARQ